MPGRLCSKVALVTGGAQGLGRGICLAFAREGASVAIVDVKEEGMEETLKMMSTEHGNKHCSIVADVTNTEQVKQAFRTAKEKLGQKCTILVNNAGINVTQPFLEMTDEMFDKVININLKGVFLMSREFISFLKEDENHPPASIVNMASLAGRVGSVGFHTYGASKAGVIAMTKCVAKEFANENIRCNSLMPGVIMTEILQTVPQERLQQVVQTIPMGRIGEPEDVANACLYLASDESGYITGTTLEITGGLHA